MLNTVSTAQLADTIVLDHSNNCYKATQVFFALEQL